MIDFLAIGIVLGISAGFAPGPLLALVVSETLQHGTKAGIKVALAPVITDLPIIILTFWVLSELSNFHNILGMISLAGGLFILSMSYQNICKKGIKPNAQEAGLESLIKGVLSNILSPHPYLFWFTVGVPIMNQAIRLNGIACLAFIMGFYTFLVGSKMLLAILIGKSKFFLDGKIYIYIMRCLGVVLGILSFALFQDGLRLLAMEF